MEIILYLLLLLSVFQLLCAFLNLIFVQKIQQHSKVAHKISVLIPARNEAQNIETILTDLCADKSLEIIVANDNSEDNTLAILKEFQKTHPIKVVNLAPLPVDWKGKNYACHQLALQATGSYLLFLDADVRIKTELIHAATHYLTEKKSSLLSIFPTQLMKTPGEWATVPLMHYILLSLLPLVFVRYSPFKSHIAANGQFMLFEKEVYKQLTPHAYFKKETVEDLRIAEYFKTNQLQVLCLAGDKRIQCRMYHDYNSAVLGFAKNIRMFFKNSFVFAFLFWLTHCFGWLPFLFHPILLIPYCCCRGLTGICTSIVAQQSILKNLNYFIPQCYALSHILWLNLRHRFHAHIQWKGRAI